MDETLAGEGKQIYSQLTFAVDKSMAVPAKALSCVHSICTPDDAI